MKYFVYILENQKGRHYTGITTDPVRRLAEHNAGSAKATRPFGPWQVIYQEKFASRRAACRREWFLKNPPGRKEKIEIIRKYGGVA